MNRREFIRTGSAAAAVAAFGGCATKAVPTPVKRTDFMWGGLVHLGFNMWNNHADHLVTEPAAWNAIVAAMHRNRFNAMVVDLGEALVYPSHPELAVTGSWSPAKLRDELARLRDLGITPYPKLNFSLTHCEWMKQYRQMVSTPRYYEVVADLIRDAVEVFDGPEYVHIGYDEEQMPGYQSKYPLAMFRQGDLWWHDFLYTVGEVEKYGARAWTFSDVAWKHLDEFKKNMPKSVVQCPWNFVYDKKLTYFVDSVKEMSALGYDIVPDLCTYTRDPSRIQTCEAENWMEFCLKGGIPEKQLKGFLVCTWRSVTETNRDYHERAYAYGGELRTRWEKSVRR